MKNISLNKQMQFLDILDMQFKEAYRKCDVYFKYYNKFYNYYKKINNDISNIENGISNIEKYNTLSKKYRLLEKINKILTERSKYYFNVTKLSATNIEEKYLNQLDNFFIND